MIDVVLLIGESHVLTGGWDMTVAVSDQSTGASVDGISLDFSVLHAATTIDDRVPYAD